MTEHQPRRQTNRTQSSLLRLAVSIPLLCATVAGALLGALLSQPRAAACECAEPVWQLTLTAERSSAEDVPAWPPVAQLRSRPGTVELSSQDIKTQTIDLLHAGQP
jgi:hypothetical protein